MAIKLPSVGNGGLTNGAIVNGVAYFTQITPPASRLDSSPLLTGDRWWNPSKRMAGFWQTPYWLSETVYYVADLPRSVSGSQTATGQVLVGQLNHESIFLESVAWGSRTAITADVSNYWNIQGRYDSGGSANMPGALITLNQNIADYVEVVTEVNLAINLSGGCRYLQPPSFTKVGRPSSLDGLLTYKFRIIL